MDQVWLWVEVVTRLGDRGVPDSAFEAAAAVFGGKQLADLTIAIGLMTPITGCRSASVRRPWRSPEARQGAYTS